MLAIRKNHKAVKVITAGSIAFAVGLTGAAAYIDRSLQHENLVFSKEQNTSKTSENTPASQATNTSSPQGAATSQDTTSPQVASGSFAPVPAGAQSLAPAPPSSATTTVTAPTASNTTTTIVTTSPTPGMGGGSSAPPAPSGGSSGGSSGGLLDVVDGILDPVGDTLGL